jgi:hypothetical protein
MTVEYSILWDVTSCTAFYQVTGPHISEDSTFLSEEGARDDGRTCAQLQFLQSGKTISLFREMMRIMHKEGKDKHRIDIMTLWNGRCKGLCMRGKTKISWNDIPASRMRLKHHVFFLLLVGWD